MDDLSAEEKTQALVKHRMDEINLYYTAATGIHNDKHIQALRHPYLAVRRYLIHQTGYPRDADQDRPHVYNRLAYHLYIEP